MAAALVWEKDGRDWPNRDASRFIEAGGVRWHVQVMGQGPVALLVHGTGASTHSWRDFAPLLAQNFTVVAMDLPGHGFTSAPPASRLTLDGMAAGLAQLLGALNLAPALAIGHSAGAAIVLRMSLDRAIRPQHVVSLNGALLPYGGAIADLLSPVARFMALNPLVPRFFAWQASGGGAVERMLKNTGSQIDARGTLLYARLLASPAHVAAVLSMMAGWNLAKLKRELPALDALVLLVAGGRDQMIPAEQAFEVRKLLPNARVLNLRHHGHLAHEQNPAEIAGIAVKFAGEKAPVKEPSAA